MNDIELPPLPAPFMELHRDIGTTVYDAWAAQMQAYARAAVEADRAQRVPDGELLTRHERSWHRMGELWERCQGKGWPQSESAEFTRLRDEVTPATRAALLASTPAPAQQEPSDATIAQIEREIEAMLTQVESGSFPEFPARTLELAREVAKLIVAQHQEPPQQERNPMTDEIVRLAGVVLNEMPHPMTNWQSAAKKVCEAVAAIKEQT